MAYYKLEPFGEERADLRMGILASVMANAWRGKGQKPFKPRDFMPTFDTHKKPQSIAEQKAILKNLVTQMRKPRK